MVSKTMDNLQSPIAELKANGVSKEVSAVEHRLNIKWFNVCVMSYLNWTGFYGIYLMCLGQAYFATFMLQWVLGTMSAIGITAGVHRLWSHRGYKATTPLRLFLAFCQTISFQNDIYHWARDHRVHHKYVDTYADPHDSRRGFFYSHMGWLLVDKHPEVAEKGKSIDMSDLQADQIVMFQRKYYTILMPLIAFILPTLLPVYLWGETLWMSWHVVMVRCIVHWHFTWCVNSFAHMYGNRPYDKEQTGRENIPVTIIAFGEGWHNYHHTFPWDYRASELSDNRYNFTTGLIHIFAKLGMASELRTPSEELVRQKILASGDGSHWEHKPEVWGWGDKDLEKKDKDMADVNYPDKRE